MNEAARRAVIQRYLDAYNAFDIERMLAQLADDVHFEDVSGGQVTATADGIDAFRRLAEQGCRLFSEREQRITALAFDGDTARVEIAWRGRFAVDVPGGPRAGTQAALQGRSEFTFDGLRIARLVDAS
ncbi:nuclear transport factor 2 family protein [Massilia forsythiae]|uniref:Nuclear transport factor 2 family protein n=1 Tax=Massilia forsythiae TaxID=2728020 RepID=A0A7Z2W0A8_9BURK|nr:nuclear transport factor 2 family protein [Massilia forsythiae]QJE02137.1 nuclear transport factor 2 family protein [Massilia forsythiae]